jgi:hypothetical protein
MQDLGSRKLAKHRDTYSNAFSCDGSGASAWRAMRSRCACAIVLLVTALIFSFSQIYRAIARLF